MSGLGSKAKHSAKTDGKFWPSVRITMVIKENIASCLFFCNLESEDLYHFVLRCPYFRND